jgi:hypothetical protein
MFDFLFSSVFWLCRTFVNFTQIRFRSEVNRIGRIYLFFSRIDHNSSKSSIVSVTVANFYPCSSDLIHNWCGPSQKPFHIIMSDRNNQILCSSRFADIPILSSVSFEIDSHLTRIESKTLSLSRLSLVIINASVTRYLREWPNQQGWLGEVIEDQVDVVWVVNAVCTFHNSRELGDRIHENNWSNGRTVCEG